MKNKILGYIFSFIANNVCRYPVVNLQRGKRKYKKRKKFAWGSFKDLKGHLECVFNELENNDYVGKDGYSVNVGKETIEGMRELGPYMMGNMLNMSMDEPFMQSKGRKLPTFAFLGFPHKVENTKGFLSPRFVFATKLKKKGIKGEFERIKKDEVLYELGFAIVDEKPPRWARKRKNKLCWVCFYHALNKITGKSRVLRHRNIIRNKHYTRVEFVRPPEEIKDNALSCVLNEWVQRDFHWQVQAIKDNKIVTFCIEDNEAKHYFKDREVKDNGVRKKIFHWVKAHHRKTSKGYTTVKTHFRGNRNFTWADFSISIRVPGLHSHMLSQFDVKARHGDKAKKELMDMRDVAHELNKEILRGQN